MDDETTRMTDADVVIIGAGILGLVNALQLAKRGLSVALVDNLRGQSRSFKVGESLLIFSSMFLRTVGEIDSFLQTSFPKHGVWFTYGMEGTNSFEGKSEWGLESLLPDWLKRKFKDEKLFRALTSDVQIVRPEAEDKLLDVARAHGRIKILDTAHVRAVTLGNDDAPHEIAWECKATKQTGSLRARWIVDCSGRNRFMAKKFKHAAEEPMLADGFQTTAVWAQFKGIDDSMFESWKATFDQGFETSRDLNTLHLWGDGYWIWVIRLSEGRISVGATYDQRSPLPGATFKEQFWNVLRRHPIFDAMLRPENVLEFRSYKNVQYVTDTFVSERRYGMVGDAASIIDAYYSQGMSLAYVTSWHLANIIHADVTRGSLDREYIARVNEATRNDWLMLRHMVADKFTPAIADGRFFLLSHLLDMVIFTSVAVPRYHLARWLVETAGMPEQETPIHRRMRESMSKRLYYSSSPLFKLITPATAQRLQGHFQRKLGERARWRIAHGLKVGSVRCVMRPPLAGLLKFWKLPGARYADYIDISPASVERLPDSMNITGEEYAPPALAISGVVAASLFLAGYAYDWADTTWSRAQLVAGKRGSDSTALPARPASARRVNSGRDGVHPVVEAPTVMPS